MYRDPAFQAIFQGHCSPVIENLIKAEKHSYQLAAVMGLTIDAKLGEDDSKHREQRLAVVSSAANSPLASPAAVAIKNDFKELEPFLALASSAKSLSTSSSSVASSPAPSSSVSSVSSRLASLSHAELVHLCTVSITRLAEARIATHSLLSEDLKATNASVLLSPSTPRPQ
jgi:hypothetical protein